MMPDEELEISEREKYNYFVTEKEYGKDFKREKQINKITNHLGEVSKGFLNTLEELKQKDIFNQLQAILAKDTPFEALVKQIKKKLFMPYQKSYD